MVTTPQPMTLPGAGPEGSRFVAEELSDRGIEVRTAQPVQVVNADARTVSFPDGGRLAYALLLAVPQTAPPQVVADSPLAGEGGWIHPDRETLHTGFERVYAAGDCTAPPPPQAGVFAEAMARVAARNIAAEIDDGHGDRFDGTGYCFLESPGSGPRSWRAISSPTQSPTYAWPDRTPRRSLANRPSRPNGFVAGSTSAGDDSQE